MATSTPVKLLNFFAKASLVIGFMAFFFLFGSYMYSGEKKKVEAQKMEQIELNIYEEVFRDRMTLQEYEDRYGAIEKEVDTSKDLVYLTWALIALIGGGLNYAIFGTIATIGAKREEI